MSVKVFAETARLILRELVPSDAEGMFILDSDPEVHRFLGNTPMKTREEAPRVIDFVRQQCAELGIGRWAVEERATGEFVGWAGLKRMVETVNGHRDFIDLGYRLQRRHWGKGYATEASLASRDYAFQELGEKFIYAEALVEHASSRAVLEKVGFVHNGDFDLPPWGLHAWYEMAAPDPRASAHVVP